MTLRESLGGDVQRIHELVDALLDKEDGVLALFDGGRVVSFAHGFGVSSTQLELLSVELERSLRSVVGRPPAGVAGRRNRRDSNESTLRRDRLDRNGRSPADGVLRLASKVA